MTLTYTLTAAPDPADLRVLERGIAEAFALEGRPSDAAFAIFVRDENEALIGGVSAKAGWDQLYIEVLYVAASVRGKGIGARLMQQAEDEGRRQGCVVAWLDTSTEAAKKFYESCGYECFGMAERRAPSCPRYWLKKKLLPSVGN